MALHASIAHMHTSYCTQWVTLVVRRHAAGAKLLHAQRTTRKGGMPTNLKAVTYAYRQRTPHVAQEALGIFAVCNMAGAWLYHNVGPSPRLVGAPCKAPNIKAAKTRQKPCRHMDLAFSCASSSCTAVCSRGGACTRREASVVLGRHAGARIRYLWAWQANVQ